MNIYEMIKDICPDYGTMCSKCNLYGHCSVEYTAKSLIFENYHKVAADEIVVKKNEYEELKAANDNLKQEIKSLESGLALLQQKYEELGVEITKHTCVEHSLNESTMSVVDYITIPFQRLAIPRKIKGELR